MSLSLSLVLSCKCSVPVPVPVHVRPIGVPRPPTHEVLRRAGIASSAIASLRHGIQSAVPLPSVEIVPLLLHYHPCNRLIQLYPSHHPSPPHSCCLLSPRLYFDRCLQLDVENPCISAVRCVSCCPYHPGLFATAGYDGAFKVTHVSTVVCITSPTALTL